MPINRASFEIEIKSHADLAAMKATIATLEGQIEATKELGHSTADLEVKLQSLRSKMMTAELAKAGDSAKEAGEGFKIFGRSAHDAHAAIEALGEAIPGISEIIHFLANPITAAIGTTVLVFTKFKEAIKDCMDALNGLANSPGAQSDYIENQRQAILASTDAQADWEDQIRRLVDAQETLKQKTDELVEHQRAQIDAENEISQAQKALAEARVDLAVKLGQLTPEQAIKIKLEIDEQAFKEQAEIKIKEMQAELEARMKETIQNNAREPELNRNVQTTKTAAEAADAAKIRNEAKLKQDQENLEASKGRQAQADKIIEELDGKGTWGGDYDKSDPQYYKLKAAKDTQAAEQNSQAMLRHSISQEQSKQPALDVNSETAKADYEASKTAYEEATKEAKDLQTQIEKLRRDLDVEKAKAATLETLHNQTAETRAQGQTIDDQNRTAEAVQHGNATPQQQQEFTDQQIEQRAAREPGAEAAVSQRQATTRATQILQLVRNHTASRDNLSELHSILEETIGHLQNQSLQLNGQRYEMSDLRSQLRDLDSQMRNSWSRNV